MDLILLQKMGDNISPFGLGFNPYFNGSNTSTWLEVTWIFCSLDVSILILMDLILLPDEELRNRFRKVGFNPYFNGSNTSTILRNYSFLFLLQCFNPYFNGSNTSTLTHIQKLWARIVVSILILMDLILLLYTVIIIIIITYLVSILILMDLILLQYFADSIKQTSTSFQSLF